MEHSPQEFTPAHEKEPTLAEQRQEIIKAFEGASYESQDDMKLVDARMDELVGLIAASADRGEILSSITPDEQGNKGPITSESLLKDVFTDAFDAREKQDPRWAMRIPGAEGLRKDMLDLFGQQGSDDFLPAVFEDAVDRYYAPVEEGELESQVREEIVEDIADQALESAGIKEPEVGPADEESSERSEIDRIHERQVASLRDEIRDILVLAEKRVGEHSETIPQANKLLNDLSEDLATAKRQLASSHENVDSSGFARILQNVNEQLENFRGTFLRSAHAVEEVADDIEAPSRQLRPIGADAESIDAAYKAELAQRGEPIDDIEDDASNVLVATVKVATPSDELRESLRGLGAQNAELAGRIAVATEQLDNARQDAYRGQVDINHIMRVITELQRTADESIDSALIGEIQANIEDYTDALRRHRTLVLE